MKKIIALTVVTVVMAAAAALIVLVPTEVKAGGLGSPTTLMNRSVTNAANYTNTYDCSAGKSVQFLGYSGAAAANLSNVTVTVNQSLDGSHWSLLTSFGWATVGAGTIACQNTNIEVGAAQWLQIVVSTTALSTSPLSNVTVKAVSK